MSWAICPSVSKSDKRGRPPIGLERMLRNFKGIDLSRTSVPGATTVMGFRHLLEAHDLTKAMLVEVNVMLIERVC